MSYQEENDALFLSFLEHTFFKAWKTHDPKLVNFMNLELILNYKCNLGCVYCYVHNHGEELYPPDLYADEEKVLHNLELLLNWLLEKGFSPDFEFFSGEALVQEVGFKALNMILDKLGGKMKSHIVIPTNYTFLFSKKLTAKVEALIEKAKKVDIPIYLSASVDGKFCDDNRPLVTGGNPRGDEFYDKMFEFNKSHDFGFHPMIYSKHIRDWKDNFLWFQKNFERYAIPWHNIYLLEVRNAEWTLQQTRDFADFVYWLIKWTYENPCKGSKDALINFILFAGGGAGYNMLSATLHTHGRGIGCAFESMLYVRLGNLSIVPCHRTSYEPFILGNFKVENDEIVGVESRNTELAIFKHSLTASTFPYCEQCLLRSLCGFGCLGSQLETTGDLFTPIPTVCRLQHAKVMAMIKAYKEIGVLDSILGYINPDKAYAIRRLVELNEQ